ncbi:MAG: hypothetical protein OEY47_02885 [Candidatus Bathyarchaeota archaeon]|nr:hypothetical protein [Candidatus Bathyarchaeota archaeon]
MPPHHSCSIFWLLGADAEIELEHSVSVDIDTATLHYVPCCRHRDILKIQYS